MTSRQAQTGAALLLAMVILTLVSTVAAGMVWAQQRAIEVESAERSRTQSAWILNGALDWACLILREDLRQRSGQSSLTDNLGEPWAVPLAEARLSTFLAADRTAGTDDGPDAFLSGRISDLQARYNLRHVLKDDGTPDPAEVAVLQRIVDSVGAPASVAIRIATALAAAQDADDPSAALAPQTLTQLSWLGIEAAALRLLAPYVVLLPEVTPVNVNTAPREVIAAVLGIDRGLAERLLQQRQRAPFDSTNAVQSALPVGVTISVGRIDVKTRFFEVVGRLRLDDRVLVESSIVERRNAREVVPIRRERRSALETLP